jgi:hypothetical protein
VKGEQMGENAPTSCSATTDEMDDLELVTLFQNSLVPAVPRHDVAVEFYGDPVCFHPELLDESGEGERIRRVWKVPLIAVDLEFHRTCFLPPLRDWRYEREMPLQTARERPVLHIGKNSTRICGGRIFWWRFVLRSWPGRAAKNRGAKPLLLRS